MTISFARIPTTLRKPFIYFEVDSSQAGGSSSSVKPALLCGQRLSTGTVAAAVPTRINSALEAATYFGESSMLHRMAVAYRAQDTMGELWAVAVADPAGAVETLALTVSAAATGNGTLYLYIGGQLLTMAVTSGDTANAIAAALTTAINAANSLPVSAVNTGAPSAIVTLSSLHAGALAREIDVRANYRGVAGGESYPASVTITAGAVDIAATPARLAGGGAGVPTVPTMIASLGDTEYDYIAWPWADDTTLDLMETEMGDDTGRWSPTRPVYGHVFTVIDDTPGTLTSAGNARNSQHSTLVGIESCPSPTWEICAAVVGQVAKARAADVAAVYHQLPLVGILAPRPTDRFTFTESNTLMSDGVTILDVGAGDVLYTGPILTTYQTAPGLVPDDSMLDYTTMSDLTYIHRDFKARMQKYNRHRVADDGTQFGPGKAIVTPSMIKAEAVTAFRAWETAGIVEDFDGFIAALIVERDGSNPKRINVLLPPDVTNALEVMAVKTQFRR